MAFKFVVGLFESKGIAEDAVHRLRHLGVPENHVSLLLLREIAAPVPATVKSELDALSADPLVVGDARESFATFIRNGETAIFVRAEDEAEVDQAIDTIRQYAPLRIRVVTAGEGAAIGRDVLHADEGGRGPA
ncbi:MAG TPA: hypothetical protein VJR70_02060 [Stellaceae bacterium]|nr:hypothetical protein [Stellaceae bacterium]